jgi:hypothetical protein
VRRAIIDADCVMADGTIIDASVGSAPPCYVSPEGVALVTAFDRNASEGRGASAPAFGGEAARGGDARPPDPASGTARRRPASARRGAPTSFRRAE